MVKLTLPPGSGKQAEVLGNGAERGARGRRRPQRLGLLKSVILVFADRSDDDLSQQALTFARSLGDGDVQAVAIDDPKRGYSPDGWATAWRARPPSAGRPSSSAPGTERGNEVLAHVAAILDLPFAANCTGATPGDPPR